MRPEGRPSWGRTGQSPPSWPRRQDCRAPHCPEPTSPRAQPTPPGVESPVTSRPCPLLQVFLASLWFPGALVRLAGALRADGRWLGHTRAQPCWTLWGRAFRPAMLCLPSVVEAKPQGAAGLCEDLGPGPHHRGHRVPTTSHLQALAAGRHLPLLSASWPPGVPEHHPARPGRVGGGGSRDGRPTVQTKNKAAGGPPTPLLPPLQEAWGSWYLTLALCHDS